MIYILDTSFFIETSRLHLPLDEHPDFWSWLVNLAKSEKISIPEMVYTELIAGNDSLTVWMKRNKDVLVDQKSAFAQLTES